MTQPRTDRSVRKLRHSIRKRAFYVLKMTGGIPGASKEVQVQILDKQIELLNEALAKAKEAREIVSTRDFEAYKAAKDAQAEAPSPEKITPSEEKAMTDLTVEELINQLTDKSPGTGKPPAPTGDEPDATPPF